MRQDELERALRETFARRVAAPGPLAVDPAGVAIRRANRAARRRTMAGLALAAVATAVVTTGMAQLREQPGHRGTPTVVLGDPRGVSASPLPTAARPAPPAKGSVRAEVDMIVGAWLETSGGERREVTVGPVDRAQRVPDHGGWLITSAATAAGRTLWWLPPNGSPAQVLLAGADAIAVAPDGRQVAWRDGPDLVAAGLVGGQLVATVRTTAPAAVPVGFAGDAVLVRQPDQAGFAVWRRSAGALSSEAERSVLNVYGALPDGRVVGQVSAGAPRRPCLALLDPARGLAPAGTSCGPALSTDGRGGISADGRWLLVNGAGKDALLVDLRTLGSDLSTRPAGPAVSGAVAWTSGGTALHVDGAGRLVRVRVDRVLAGDRPTAAPVPGVAPGERPVVVADIAP